MVLINIISENYIIFEITLATTAIDKDFEKFSDDALFNLAQQFIGKKCFYSTHFGPVDCIIENTYIAYFGPGQKQCVAVCRMQRNEVGEHILDLITQRKIEQASISCRVAKKICSICGKNQFDEECEHIPGETYSDKLCYYILDDVLQVYDWSLVNEFEGEP